MKRLLAILLAWLTSLYNNVAYVETENTSYQPEMYYRLETGESKPDYRTNQQITNRLDERSVCFQNNYIATALDYSAEYLRVDGKNDDYGYWWQVSTSSTPFDLSLVDNSSQSFTLESGAIIVAPFKCYRTTSATTIQPSPVAMTVEFERNGDLYIVNITNMYCWACDAFRDLPEIDGIPAITHSYKDEGHSYSKGEVLGIATDNCIIQVWKKSGSSTQVTSWKEFYNLDV